jgi:thioredoxin-like negative regulator of GroEL
MKYRLIGDVELQEILDRNSSWALIAFTSCGSIPCNHFRPEFTAITNHFITKVFCAEINVDDNPTIVAKLGVVAVPTTLLFHNEKEKGRFEGPYTREALIERIAPLLAQKR